MRHARRHWMLSTPSRTLSQRRARNGDYFLFKADIDAPDWRLRALRSADGRDAPPENGVLLKAVEAAVGARVATISSSPRRGTFHWVVAAELADGRAVVVRVQRLRHPALAAALTTEA